MKLFVYIILAVVALTTAWPMTNDDGVVSSDPIEQLQAQSQLPQHILKIAPRQIEPEQEERPGLFDTIVEELRAAGIHRSERGQLHTLSYKELTRLLALWHLTQERNFYEANDDNISDNSNDKINTQQQQPKSG